MRSHRPASTGTTKRRGPSSEESRSSSPEKVQRCSVASEFRVSERSWRFGIVQVCKSEAVGRVVLNVAQVHAGGNSISINDERAQSTYNNDLRASPDARLPTPATSASRCAPASGGTSLAPAATSSSTVTKATFAESVSPLNDCGMMAASASTATTNLDHRLSHLSAHLLVRDLDPRRHLCLAASRQKPYSTIQMLSILFAASATRYRICAGSGVRRNGG